QTILICIRASTPLSPRKCIISSHSSSPSNNSTNQRANTDLALAFDGLK
ncbi:hypothetical protein M5D96_004088, partial [Drosophila gunungcola]